MKILAALFTIFILVIIILADTGSLGFLAFLYNFPYGDKAGHFILYGILSFLLNLTFLRSRPHSTSKRVAVSVTLILAWRSASKNIRKGSSPIATPASWI